MLERASRYAIGALGVLVGLWGLWLMWKESPYIDKINFGTWLIGGVLLHDLIIASVVWFIGWLLAKTLPPHIRGFAQGALVVLALTGSVAFFMVWRQGEFANQPSKALLQQDYVANFGIIAAAVVVCTAVLYTVSLFNMRKSRPE